MIIPDDIAPRGHDDLDISVEAWRRLDAQPKLRNWLRDRVRTFRFLRSPASATLLPGGDRALSDAVIAPVAFVDYE